MASHEEDIEDNMIKVITDSNSTNRPILRGEFDRIRVIEIAENVGRVSFINM